MGRKIGKTLLLAWVYVAEKKKIDGRRKAK